MTQQLHITSFPNDNRTHYSSHIEVTRHENYIEVKQDNWILGSIKLEPLEIVNPEFECTPIVEIIIRMGVSKK